MLLAQQAEPPRPAPGQAPTVARRPATPKGEGEGGTARERVKKRRVKATEELVSTASYRKGVKN